MTTYLLSYQLLSAVIGVHYWSSTRKKMANPFIEYESKRGAILLYRRLSNLVKAKSQLYVREFLYATSRLILYDFDRASILTRALLDALTMKVEPLTGPYEPLLLDLPLRKLPYALSRRLFQRLIHSLRDRLATLVISKDVL